MKVYLALDWLPFSNSSLCYMYSWKSYCSNNSLKYSKIRVSWERGPAITPGSCLFSLNQYTQLPTSDILTLQLLQVTVKDHHFLDKLKKRGYINMKRKSRVEMGLFWVDHGLN